MFHVYLCTSTVDATRTLLASTSRTKKTFPLLGNLLHMRSGYEWFTFLKWCNEYESDIIYLKVLGTSMIVLNTYETSIEFLESRSSIYSGRPWSTMVNDLMGWKFNFGFNQYGMEHNYNTIRQKLIFEKETNAADLFKPPSVKAARDMLQRCIDEPDDILAKLRHMSSQSIISIAYGLEVASKDDPYIGIAERAVVPLAFAGAPGAFMVDLAKKWNAYRVEMLGKPFAAAKEAISQENKAGQNTAIDEQSIKEIAGVMYTGGADTTVSAIASCILALLDHPEVLRKAQQELDNVLGSSRLPEFSDMDSLPYSTAVVKETMRWRPVAPLNLPHQLLADDEYRGYRFPAGSIVIQNAWAMLHDENVYPNPLCFKPERFIKDGKWDSSVRDPLKICFGAGRRICPARFMAFPSVWITVVSMMAAFDIRKSVDELGNIIEPDRNFISSLVCTPN
ncbi:cytochrome P450 [Agrocybe pediades]|nr:cytochrome P450 [Agrocybe pediades]